LITLNQEFIDGSWYEEEYRRKWYKLQYIDTPEPSWAKQTKDYYNGLIIAYTGIKPNMKILDLGAGVGQVVQAWERIGFINVHGIEISETAVKHANHPNVICGSAQKMPYKDGEFDLVSSHAFFEHIDESILPEVISECFRVGKRQAHTIGLEKGDDPSHINIKTMDEWLMVFAEAIKNKDWLVAHLPDPLLNIGPVLVAFGRQYIPDQVWKSYNQQVAA